MKFRMFTRDNGVKIAINIDRVIGIVDKGGVTAISLSDNEDEYLTVKEDFDTVLSRLNTIAE